MVHLGSWLRQQGATPAARTRPDLETCVYIQTAFCIPEAFAGSPYGDGKRIWTPAYGCYDDTWRARMLSEITRRGYTHFVYNWAGMPYSTHYPELAADPERARRDLEEIIAAGLIPLVAMTDDRKYEQYDYTQPFIDACRDLIWVYFPQWEMNGQMPHDEYIAGRWEGQIVSMLRYFAAQLPDAVKCIHFTPNHGAGGHPESQWWYNVTVTEPLVQVSLQQMDYFDDVAINIEGMQSMIDRLDWRAGQQHTVNYPRVDARVNVFETQTTMLYHKGRSEADGLAFMDAIMAGLHHHSGFSDSGTVRPR